MSIHIENLFIKQDNVNGDNNLWLGADGPAKKIDAGGFLWVAAVTIGGACVYGLAVGAYTFAVWIAPAVVTMVGGGATGIGLFTLYKRRLLAKPPIEDIPAVVIEAATPVTLPVEQPRALRSAEVAELVEFIEKDGRVLKEWEIDHIERQIIGQQPAAKILPLCAPSESSLPSASSQLRMQSSL